MPSTRYFEAVWTLQPGPLHDQQTAANLFVAIGQVRYVEPVRYDLDRRGQWRDYDGRRLIVDVVTQRTQLVTVAEEDSVDEGGALVVISTGKQGEPPQASVRWRDEWPPTHEQIQAWQRAAEQAFDSLRLDTFVLRVADELDDISETGTAIIGASRTAELARRIDTVGAGRRFGRGAEVGRMFAPDDRWPPPDAWLQLWR